LKEAVALKVLICFSHHLLQREH